MTYNEIAYLLYLPFTVFLTWWVGKNLHQKGVFLLRESFGDSPLINTINKFLLLGYYLINIGYAVLSLSLFPKLIGYAQLVSVLGFRLGFIMSSLAIIHYFNILVIRFFPVEIKKFLQT